MSITKSAYTNSHCYTIGLPLFAFGTIIPSMGLMAILSYLWYRAVCGRDARLATEPAE